MDDVECLLVLNYAERYAAPTETVSDDRTAEIYQYSVSHGTVDAHR
jgi:hypothetical protein